MSDFPSSDELRAMVRQVIREALPAGVGQATPASPTIAPPPAVVEHVSLRNDADLAAFVHRILDAASDTTTAEALRAGRVKFVLAGEVAAGPAATKSTGGYRIEKGAVTERHVKAAAEAGGRLVLGARAILTPLAKDRARFSGVSIERES